MNELFPFGANLKTMSGADALKARADAIRDREKRREQKAEREREMQAAFRAAVKEQAEALRAGLAPLDKLAVLIRGQRRLLWLDCGPDKRPDGLYTWHVTVKAQGASGGADVVSFAVMGDMASRRIWIEHDDTAITQDIACGLAIDIV